MIFYFIRENIPSKRNIKFQALQHPMARAVSRIVVYRRKKANLIHHVILPTIHPRRIAHSSFSQHQMSKSQSFLIILKLKRTAQIQQVVLMGKLNKKTQCLLQQKSFKNI